MVKRVAAVSSKSLLAIVLGWHEFKAVKELLSGPKSIV
jgi:hypothetical protein